MLTDFLTLVTIAAATVSCAAAVFSVWFVRRGSDAELKTDVEELALLVERLAKTTRREKMARVRSASKDQPGQAVSVPVDYPQDIKTALRARVAAVTPRRR